MFKKKTKKKTLKYHLAFQSVTNCISSMLSVCFLFFSYQTALSFTNSAPFAILQSVNVSENVTCVQENPGNYKTEFIFIIKCYIFSMCISVKLCVVVISVVFGGYASESTRRGEGDE